MPKPAEDLARRPLPGELARLLHDLRGPLNSAVVHLEVLKRATVDDPLAADSLRAVLEQVSRLSEMLPAAFAICALEPGPMQAVALRPLMGTVLEALAGHEVVLAPGPWPAVCADPALLSLALQHLVRNAVEATKPGAPAPRVSAAVDGDRVRIAIRDWGDGLRTTNPRLLIRLERSTKPGHAGIGLLVVERVARLHGGSVTFVAPGDGTEVTLLLPRSE